MALNLTGTCTCKNLQYTVKLDSADSARTSLCHCSSCKKAFGTNFGLTSKENGVIREFCENCGSFTCEYGEQAADKFRYITYGTLDDPEKLPPKGEFFCKERSSWMPEIPEEETRAILLALNKHHSPFQRTRGRTPSHLPPVVTRPTRNWPTLSLWKTEHSTSTSTSTWLSGSAQQQRSAAEPVAPSDSIGPASRNSWAPPLFHRRHLGLLGPFFFLPLCPFAQNILYTLLGVPSSKLGFYMLDAGM
ncbi:hypothetical protein J7T55_007360 [Diaporthe amygdali]|uniref:uncharacterized protein n=1 Tax=Phomopsis amygdali TaxID=1214568 RepID=UPI0022FDE8CC|nr:uncharacterized protein J7T55_007360 [Diaporthe amygdali]KAJ0116380.1 hypothetical protein J7T55_007360 [Diaporthe amygdali]